LESLDTNTLSIVIFIIQTISLITVLLLLIKQSMFAAILSAIFWILLQLSFSIYGYITDQLGFFLMGVINIIISMIGVMVGVYRDEEISNED
jgi:hypothetical protein